jgi:glucosamine--fructose-6-phosphate aminotransferase (isomerizing)
MCGIIGYIGKKEAYPILLDGLQKLEYRGYDSAGIALMNGRLNVYKKKGKVADLRSFTEGKKIGGSIGIGHTRWATHGEPSDVNAHPHVSGTGRFTLVHNGIIENHEQLKNKLQEIGHVFQSRTDTEVLVHWIEHIQLMTNFPIKDALRTALKMVQGSYAIAIIDKKNPDQLIAARKGSPLVIGLEEEGFFIASDPNPIAEYTQEVIYLEDEQLAVLDLAGNLSIQTIRGKEVTPIVEKIQIEVKALDKGDFDSFMQKEIHEQVHTINKCIKSKLTSTNEDILVPELAGFWDNIENISRFIITACGTSWHAGLIGEFLFEDLARIPVEVEYASEFRYRNPILNQNDLVMALSQSGETADTLAALDLAKQNGILTQGIVNVVSSSIARMTDITSYIQAGTEIGVASTKAYTGQVTMLTLLALAIAKKRKTISSIYFDELLNELKEIPTKISRILEKEKDLLPIATSMKDATNALFLGRGYNFPTALEGALKLKEISYIHAEGYPAAEMKHGPIALIDENMPVIVIATNKSAYEKIVSNIQEVKARKGKIIAIITEGDKTIKSLADYYFEIPSTIEPLTPLLSIIPLQILSYYTASLRGCNVDQPRNLAKSVTVE